MYEHTYRDGTTISLASIVRHLLAMRPDEIVGTPRKASDCLISRYFSHSIDGAFMVETCSTASTMFSPNGGHFVNLYHPEWMQAIIIEFDRRFGGRLLDHLGRPSLATRDNALAMLRDLSGAQEVDDLIAEAFTVKEAVPA